jgi:hypothetical protein
MLYTSFSNIKTLNSIKVEIWNKLDLSFIPLGISKLELVVIHPLYKELEEYEINLKGIDTFS